ncbi:hypothetical protein TVAG_419870 [Trichomonas vaginalis G3]|uniref:ATPase dynein-related AAA domain-containing protein n=1 Tax=Trichomonas vaginalis (strain ATCC PRA-98 / G3) TaxID=412133 RepID=A2EIW1_TRIV3|nr:nuclear chaperone required for maturation and nuclear export of pre-60s ribosome subunits [Trichomonas vaginalis G3]EAY07445.1 hypothetical protein TVAG_419870 [Trichomonas vaginalis G3]KAI5484655.1 nuclear chaperone required for maturation and nuclear export of pre-60s ribosome subunits [Trichomonas vaginalis G3]|eukprot:XP_001319668.1 hypothetical protein [Trichomonas vaginalis G3]
MGQNLVVLQLNTETSDSIVYGGYKPLSELRIEQRTEISSMLEELGKTNSFIKKIQIKDWKPNTLKNIVNELNENKILIRNQNQLTLLDNLINKISNACQFYNLIDKYDSVIVKAMKEGKWLLLDGIEACPSVILDRIISLFSSTPKLDLYEKGTDNEIIAKQNFRVFMTYNPYEATTRQRISPSLLNRCFVYTLDPIDQDFNDSFNTIFGILSQVKNLGFTSTSDFQKIVVRFVNVHLKMKSENNSNIDARTLVRLAQSLAISAPLNRTKVESILYSNYSDTLEMDDQQKTKIWNYFSEKIDENKLKRIKNSVVSHSTELDSLRNSLAELKRSNKFSIKIFIQTFLRLPFENYESFQNALTFDNQYCDVFKLISDFIKESEKLIQNDRKFDGKSLGKIQKGEFPIFDDFLLRINFYLFITDKYQVDAIEYTANDLMLLHQIDKAKSLNDALFYLLSLRKFIPNILLHPIS